MTAAEAIELLSMVPGHTELFEFERVHMVYGSKLQPVVPGSVLGMDQLLAGYRRVVLEMAQEARDAFEEAERRIAARVPK